MLSSSSETLAAASLEVKERPSVERQATLRMLLALQASMKTRVEAVRKLQYELHQVMPNSEVARQCAELARAMDAGIGPLLDEDYWNGLLMAALQGPVLRGTFRLDGQVVV